MAVTKRGVLESLTRAALLEFAADREITGMTSWPKAEIVDAMARSRSLTLPDLLAGMSRNELKAVCRAAGLGDSGRAKANIIARLLGTESTGATPASTSSARSRDFKDDNGGSHNRGGKIYSTPERR